MEDTRNKVWIDSMEITKTDCQLTRSNSFSVSTQDIPLSIMGSYMSLSINESGMAVLVNSLHGNARLNQVSMSLSFQRSGMPLSIIVERRAPDSLLLHLKEEADAKVEIKFQDPELIVIRGISPDLTMKLDLLPRYNYEFSQQLCLPSYGDCVVVNSAKNLAKYLIYGINCKLELNQKINIDVSGSDRGANNRSVVLGMPQGRNARIVIQEIFHFMSRPRPHDSVMTPKGFMSFEAFLRPYTRYGHTAEQLRMINLACMVLWSNMVQPLDQLTSWTLYSSNKRFAGMWSWDHAFGSLAMATCHPSLAIEVMRSIYSAQATNGQVPDMLTDSTTNWNYAKPPVQPMLFDEMCRRVRFKPDDTLLESFARHVDFYLDNMRVSNGLCIYIHGNDSGEDNSTLFMEKAGVVSPDLNAILIEDCLCLERWYSGVDRRKADHYGGMAGSLLKHFVSFFDDRGEIHARSVANGKFIDSGSIMPELAILIADKLSEEKRKQLVSRLCDPERLTQYGLASELVNSPYYMSDGYWRGPIWAPTTMLCYLGLVKCGEVELAQNISQRFCSLIEREGLFENYDALTGKGLRDSGFMWSAAGYLFLRQELDTNGNIIR